jgi:hypothetical protein
MSCVRSSKIYIKILHLKRASLKFSHGLLFRLPNWLYNYKPSKSKPVIESTTEASNFKKHIFNLFLSWLRILARISDVPGYSYRAVSR